MPAGTCRAFCRAWVFVAAAAAVSSVRADLFTWDNDCNNGDWHSVCGNKTNWNPDQLPGAADEAVIDDYTVSISLQPVLIQDLTVFSSLNIGRELTITGYGSLNNIDIYAPLSGGGDINLYGDSRWFQGGFLNSHVKNHNSLTIHAGFPGGVRFMSGASITNFGAIEQLVNFNMGSSRIINRGVYTLVGGTPVNQGQAVLENHGTLSGTGANSSLGVPLLMESGVVSVGTLGHSLTLSAGSTFNGGQVLVQNGGVVALSGFDDHVIASAASATGQGDFVIQGSVRVESQLTTSLTGTPGLRLLSGALNGAGALVNSGRALLESTYINNAGGLVNNAPGGATSLFIGGDFNSAVGSRLVNNGQITHNARNLRIDAGGQVINEAGGTYEIAEGALVPSISGQGILLNRGTLLKKGPQTSPVSAPVDLQSGRVQVDQGTLSFLGGGTIGAQVSIAGGARAEFNSALTFKSVTFEGSGTARLANLITVTGGNTTFNLPSEGALFDAVQGQMTLMSNVENRGRFLWHSVGSISGAGTFINAGGATLELLGSPKLVANLDNSGTVQQLDNASLLVHGQSTLTNRNVWDVNSASIGSLTPGTQVFDNTATGRVRKSGPGIFRIDLPFNNDGGLLIMSGGGTTALAGGGTHQNNAVFTFTSPGTLTLGGTHSGNGLVRFVGPGNVVLTNTYTATSGTTEFMLTGGANHALWLLQSSSVLGTQGTAQVLLNGSTLWASGTMSGGTLSGDGNVLGGIVNNGSLNIMTGGKTLAGVLRNNGTTLVAAGLTINGGHFRNDADVLFASGSANQISPSGAGGRFANYGRIDVTGSTSILVPFDMRAGEVNVVGSVSGTSTLTLGGGGNSSGSGDFTIGSQGWLIFSGPTHMFDGDYTVSGSSGATVSGTTLRGAMLFDLPTLSVASSTLLGDAGSGMINQRMAAFSDGTIAGNVGLLNNGTMLFSGTPSTVSGVLENGNQVTQLSNLAMTSGARIRNQLGASYEFHASLTGNGGFFQNEGTTRFHDNSINIIGNRFSNNGLVAVANNAHALLAGQVDQYDPAARSLSGGHWVIQSGTLTLGDGTSLHTLDANVIIFPGATFTNIPLLINHDFTNKKTLVLADTRTVVGTFNNKGILEVPGNTLLRTTDFDNEGKVIGQGRIDTRDGIFYNKGVFAPGKSPGTLTIEGDVEFDPLASLEIEIEGLIPDLEYDVLNVIGSLALDGRLDILLPLGAKTPIDVGDTFDFLTATSLTGTFSNLDPDGTVLSADGLARFGVNIGGSGVQMTLLTPVPEPAAGGLLFFGMALALRRARGGAR